MLLFYVYRVRPSSQICSTYLKQLKYEYHTLSLQGMLVTDMTNSLKTQIFSYSKSNCSFSVVKLVRSLEVISLKIVQFSVLAACARPSSMSQ